MSRSLRCPSCSAPLEVADFLSPFDKCEFCGSDLAASSGNSLSNTNSFNDNDLLGQARRLKEIKRLALDGNAIIAIKEFRETFGTGLKEAKDAVDNIRMGKPVIFTDFQTPVQGASMGAGETVGHDPRLAQIQKALQHGTKIEAIKLYREIFDVGLLEAKNAVEQIERGSFSIGTGPQQFKNTFGSPRPSGLIRVIPVIVGIGLIILLVIIILTITGVI